MHDGAQLPLLDIGPASPAPANREALLVAGVLEKLDVDAAFGLLGDEDLDPDFA